MEFKYINFVKYIRQMTGCGLREAKEAADALCAEFYDFPGSSTSIPASMEERAQKVRTAFSTSISPGERYELSSLRAENMKLKGDYDRIVELESKLRLAESERDHFLTRIEELNDENSRLAEEAHKSFISYEDASDIVREINCGRLLKAIQLVLAQVDLED